MFHNGACADWPVRGHASTHPLLVYSSKPSLFTTTPASAFIIGIVKMENNIPD
jgi:hypothetical protein